MTLRTGEQLIKQKREVLEYSEREIHYGQCTYCRSWVVMELKFIYKTVWHCKEWGDSQTRPKKIP